jgi:hypothetical protein
MNPARSLGPALVSGHLDALGLYVLAPVLGAVAAAFLYEYLRKGEAFPAPAESRDLGVLGPVHAEEEST